MILSAFGTYYKYLSIAEMCTFEIFVPLQNGSHLLLYKRVSAVLVCSVMTHCGQLVC